MAGRDGNDQEFQISREPVGHLVGNLRWNFDSLMNPEDLGSALGFNSSLT